MQKTLHLLQLACVSHNKLSRRQIFKKLPQYTNLYMARLQYYEVNNMKS